VAVFPRQKQNLKQICCSVQSDITISQEELDNSWENWQHKPVQPSTAMSAWLLTHEGCNYTHLAGEHSTKIRKSSPKPVCFFLGSPPRTSKWYGHSPICTQCCTCRCPTILSVSFHTSQSWGCVTFEMLSPELVSKCRYTLAISSGNYPYS